MKAGSASGETPLDPDETQSLRLTHLTTREELNRWEQENIQEAWEWAFASRHRGLVEEAFIRKLHKKMFGQVWKWAGQFRTTEKTVGVAPHEIAVKLKSLSEDFKTWVQEKTFPPDEMAVRFHHRLVWIHPFSNGNGRHARLLTDLILEQWLHRPRFTWGGAELEKAGDARKRYLEALRAADERKYDLLIKFVR